jgi:hypothetical protein
VTSARQLALALLATAACGAPAVDRTASPSPRAARPIVGPTASLETKAGADERAITRGTMNFTFRLSRIGNLTYQLDCLAKRITCSLPAFVERWASEWTKEDDAVIARWGDARRAHDILASFDEGNAPPKTAVPLPENGFELGKRIRIAGLIADDTKSWTGSLALLVAPPRIPDLTQSLSHFLPRFDAWWAREGRASGEPALEQLVKLFAEGQLPDHIRDAMRFYDAPLPTGTTIAFDLVVRPRSEHPTMSAEQIVTHAVIEVQGGTARDQERRIGVVTHELFHFFYNSRRSTAQADLIARFARSPDPLAIAAYGLLDESVATLLGNGVVGRSYEKDFPARLVRERSLYDDHGIDRTAKALLSRSDEVLAAGLDGEAFVPLFLRAVHEAIGDEPPPTEWLRSMAIAHSSELASGKALLQHAAHANSVYGFAVDDASAIDMFTRHEDLSGAILLTQRDVSMLPRWERVVPAKDARAIAAEAKKPRAADAPLLYAIKRSPHAWVFVIVADSEGGLGRGIDALASHRHPFVGVSKSETPR